MPTLCLLYIISLGYTPIAGTVLLIPNETEILLFTLFAGIGAATVGHFFGYQKTEGANGNNENKLEPNQRQKKINRKYVAIVIAVVTLFIIPFVINQNAEFIGTDSQGPDAIEDSGYTPWIEPLAFKPDDFGERLLFSAQIAIGSAILGFFIGHEMGKVANKKEFNIM